MFDMKEGGEVMRLTVLNLLLWSAVVVSILAYNW